MTEQKVVIIDTGCANVSSVKFAIERLGYDVTISKDPQVVLAADKPVSYTHLRAPET